MFKRFLPCLFLGLFILCAFQSQSVQNDILKCLRNNDSKAIVKYFASTVNLSVKGEERLSTKFQSELILAEYHKGNKIKSLKIVSNGAGKQSNSYIFCEVKAKKEDFQLIVKFMEIKGETSIVEFKIY